MPFVFLPFLRLVIFLSFALGFSAGGVFAAESGQKPSSSEKIKAVSVEKAAPSSESPGRAGESAPNQTKKTSDPSVTTNRNPLPEKGGAAASDAPRFLEVTDSIRRIESLGTLSSFNEGSLGRDIWAGTPRSDIALFFPALPASLPSATVTDLLRRAMLTKVDSSLFSENEPIIPGADFLTLRLEQLLHQGAYQDAFDLYALLKDKPYHPRLAQAGVSAMILTGNVALACLESRSVSQSGAPFWGDLESWCAASLEPVAGEVAPKVTGKKSSPSGVLGAVVAQKGFRFALKDFSQLGKLSLLERGVLVSRSRIDYAPDFARLVGDAPADLLSLPLYDKELPSTLRVRITAECVRRGLLSVQSLSDLYGTMAPPNAAPSASDTGLMALPFLFRTASKAKTDQEKWGAVEQALVLQPDVGWSALFPFAPIVRELVPGKISPATARRVAGLVLRAGLILPETWGSRLDETPGGIPSAPQSDDAILLDMAVSVAREDAFIHQKISQAVQALPFRESRLLAAVSDGLGVSRAGDAEKKQAYGKFNPLTGVYNYVMPSSVAYDFLVLGGESKIPGHVILSSAVALQGAEPGDVYPGILGRVLAGYESVGLHHEARKLAVEAILGLLK